MNATCVEHKNKGCENSLLVIAFWVCDMLERNGTKGSESGIARKGNGLSQSRGEKHKTCGKNRKFSPPAYLISSCHHFPPHHSAQVCLLSTRWTQFLRLDRCHLFHTLRLSCLCFLGHWQAFLNLTTGKASLPSPLSNPFSNMLSGITFQKQI